MRGKLYVRGLLRGIVAVVMGVFGFTSPVSAAITGGGETVVTAKVMPVRYVVVDDRGVVQRVVSNTSEPVTPIVHLGNFEGPIVPMTKEISQNYHREIARLDMSRPADYERRFSAELMFKDLQRRASIPFRAISQLSLPDPTL